MKKVITIGEALIDFIPNEKGLKLKSVDAFIKKPGGAPANVAVAVARLGGQSAFIGKLGSDAFGEFLIDTLKDCGVDTSNIVQTTKANTALAFVTLTKEGERDFSFYRNPSADMLLEPSEINVELFLEGDILHFCSVDLIDAPVKRAHLRAIEIANEKGCRISFDPNVRLSLWDSEIKCKETILEFVHHADILKVSDEELVFLTDEPDEERAVKRLLALCKDKCLLLVTKGAKGVTAYINERMIDAKGFSANVVDTTGAGDSFIGAFLFQIANDYSKDKIYEISDESIGDIMRFANSVGALTTMKEGAINALPTLTEVNRFLESN